MDEETIADFPSKNQIDKAGRYLRDVEAGRVIEVDDIRVSRAIATVTQFREAHAAPMGKVRAGLVSMISTESIDAVVSQRHKRVPRIVRKLVRMRGTALSRLEDIGGCRVVVQSPADMEAICRRIGDNWADSFKRPVRDYVAEPKAMGYRARHVVVVRDKRAVEIQIRTVGQQRWAEAVEAADARLKFNLKDEDGPQALYENFQIAGELIFRKEWGAPITPEHFNRLRESNKRVIREGLYLP